VNVGSLFSGIGGFDLGLERAGMRVVWQCEQDEFCRRVLARHWPGVPCYPDVRALVADPGSSRRRENAGGAHGDEGADAGRTSEDDYVADGEGEVGRVPVPVPYVDVLCGGFPCQDISLAGKGGGIDGARSGLWGEYARLVRELRPRYVIVENVAALLGRGLERVLGDLAACGYDAEWDCVPASAVGAPHRRDRLWLIAYPDGQGEPGRAVDAEPGRGFMVSGRTVADAKCAGLEGQRRWTDGTRAVAGRRQGVVQDADECAPQPWRVGGRTAQAGGPEWWAAEPPVGRVAHGVPDRLDQLAALGNALVPQIAEWLGGRIIEWEELAA